MKIIRATGCILAAGILAYGAGVTVNMGLILFCGFASLLLLVVGVFSLQESLRE